MALPNVVTFNLPAGTATTIAQVQSPGSAALQLNGTLGTTASGVLGANQQRIIVTSGGNDASIFFHIVGTNQAGFTVAEYLAGGNATFAQSNLDYRTVVSIQPSASSVAQTIGTAASTVSAGTNGVGSSPWNIMNTGVTPTNIEASGVIVSGAVNWGVQYTYDDPNFPVGPSPNIPQAFNHPTLLAATSSLDGPINDPVFGVRFIINSGTGTLRGTIIQAGIGSP